MLRPFKALLKKINLTQGCALGWYVTPLRG